MDDWDDDLDLDRRDPAGDFVELWSAESPEALWKVLTLRDGLTGAHPFEALGLFRKHHGKALRTNKIDK